MAQFKKKQSAAWQFRFLAMLPVIQGYVMSSLRGLRPEERAEAVAEAIANSFVAYAGLVKRGKENLAFATVLARYSVAQVRVGRRVGGRLNVADISSEYAQRRKRFKVARLDRFDPVEGCWMESIVEDYRTPVADQVAFRIDFATWLKTLPRRDRRIAQALAEGHRTTDVARRFGVTLARISQLRRAFFTSWQRFQGEEKEEVQMELLAAA